MNRRGGGFPAPARVRFSPVQVKQRHPLEQWTLEERFALFAKVKDLLRPAVEAAIAHGLNRAELPAVLERALDGDPTTGDLYERVVSELADAIHGATEA